MRVRERVGSSLIMGRPGKPPGSGSFDAAVCEKELKGRVYDSVEVIRDRSDSDFKGKFSCAASGACVARGADMVTNLHVTAGENEGITGLLEVPVSGRFTNLHATCDCR